MEEEYDHDYVAEVAESFAWAFAQSMLPKHVGLNLLIDGLRLYFKSSEILERAVRFAAWDSYLFEGVRYGRIPKEEVDSVLESWDVSWATKSKIRRTLKGGGKARTPPPPKHILGSIYLANSVHSYIKVGWSSNPVLRETTLQAEDPCFKLFFVSPCIFPVGTEGSIHEKFSDKRKRGEWFALDENDIEKIKRFLCRREKRLHDHQNCQA